MRDLFSDYSQRLQLEKLVIGLEEPIFIKGIGEFVAKIDSGNGGFNVIHGEDVYQNGGVLVFKTYDKDNELKQVSKKLLQFINVNIGSGKVEQRPVIELDIKFGDKEYEKIPFSVANRTSNQHKVLICKDFIQNQLDALIDVGGKMLSNRGLEVEYITEADAATYGVGVDPEVINALAKGAKAIRGGIVKGAVKGASAAKKGAAAIARTGTTVGKGIYNTLDKATNIIPGVKGMKQDIKNKGGFLKSLAAGFQSAGKFTDAAMIGGMDKNVDKAKEYDDLVKADRKTILRRIGQSDNDTLVYKLVDYQGKFYKGGNKPTPVERAHWEAFQSGNKLIASGEAAKFISQREEALEKQKEAEKQQAPPASNTTNPVPVSVNDEQEETIVESFESKITRTILEANNLDTVVQSNKQLPAASAEGTQPAVSQAPNANKENQSQEDNTFLKRYNEISDLYNNKRQRFGVYFAQVGDNIKQEAKKYDNEVERSLDKISFPKKVDGLFATIKEDKLNFNTKTGNNIINSNKFLKILNLLQEGKLSKKLSTTFAICWGNLSDRKVWLSDADITTSSYNIDALDDFIDKLDKPEDKKIVKDYQRSVYKWRKDPILQYQNCDLSQEDSFTKINDALIHPDKQNTGVDLHLDYIKNELGTDQIDKNILVSRNIVSLIQDLVINKKPKLSSEGIWEQLVRYRYKAKPIKDDEEDIIDDEDQQASDDTENSEVTQNQEEVSSDTNKQDEQVEENKFEGWENNDILNAISDPQSLSKDDLEKIKSLIENGIDSLKQNLNQNQAK